MKTRLIIEGNAVYEIDEECQACQKRSRAMSGRVRPQAGRSGEGKRKKPGR